MACLVRQLLRHDGLSLKWADTILSISRRIAIQVRPDVRHEGDDMDIRQYVSIKKVMCNTFLNLSKIYLFVKSIKLKKIKTRSPCLIYGTGA